MTLKLDRIDDAWIQKQARKMSKNDREKFLRDYFDNKENAFSNELFVEALGRAIIQEKKWADQRRKKN